MKSRLVFAFDWDNTLINSHAKGLRCMSKALEDLQFYHGEAYLNQIFCPDYHAMFQRLQIPRDLWPRLDHLWLQYYASDPPADLFPEVKTVLWEIANSGGQLALISTGQKLRIESELKFLEIKELFHYIICREDIIHLKPAPDAIELLKQQSADGEIIYVGDHDHDVNMAQNAHVQWFKIDRNIPMALNDPKNIIKDLKPLLSLLN